MANEDYLKWKLLVRAAILEVSNRKSYDVWRNEVELCFFPRRVPTNILYCMDRWTKLSTLHIVWTPSNTPNVLFLWKYRYTQVHGRKSGRAYSKHNCSSGEISQMGTFKWLFQTSTRMWICVQAKWPKNTDVWFYKSLCS